MTIQLGKAFAAPRLKIILATTGGAFTGIGVGVAFAASASPRQALAIQPTSQYVFACVSQKTGAVEYFEFRQRVQATAQRRPRGGRSCRGQLARCRCGSR